MSKLMGLKKQLQTEFKKDAEDCIKIYEKLKELSDGRDWSSQWQQLVDVKFDGFPSNKRIYKPTKLGYELLKGIEKDIQKMNIYLAKENNTGVAKIIAARDYEEAKSLTDFEGIFSCSFICSTSDYTKPSVLHTIY